MLILAGVTLNIALSDGGLFEKAKEGAEKYKKAQTNEEGIITDIEKAIDKYGSGNPTPSTPTPSEGTPTPIPIADAKSKGKFEKTETVTDENGNKVVIPGEFKIASDSGDTVQEGIVIEDSDGNQFVWIPVSNVDGDNDATNNNQNEEDLIKVEEGKTVEITLGRYTFNGSRNATLQQNGDNQEKDIPIAWFYNESIVTDRTNGGLGAKNLEKFIQSVKDNHGYYIARYEAGQDNGTPVSKMGTVWNNVTQPNASRVARGMYKDGDAEVNYVESDLVNSYAWDTAIVYIQAMDEKNKNYANATSPNSSLENTGKTGDEKCHIFDMAGNVMEWTTEYSTFYSNLGYFGCVLRGRDTNNTNGRTTTTRGYYRGTDSYGFTGFRPLLYLK